MIRARQKADISALDALRPRAQTMEVLPDDLRPLHEWSYALETDQVLIGEARLGRLEKPLSELTPDGPDIVHGTGLWLVGAEIRSEQELMKIIVATRHEPLRRLGLRQVVCIVPARGYPSWMPHYSLFGYVQQVEAGAIQAPLLGAHLRLGAKIVAVLDSPEPSVVFSWTNPVR
ncbi:MAG: hypothetical protein ACNA8W_02935 [Bradymonadaceae bacterium]